MNTRFFLIAVVILLGIITPACKNNYDKSLSSENLSKNIPVDKPAFMLDLSTGSQSLDDSIKSMLLFRWHGEFEKELDWTYKPALGTLFGDASLRQGKNGKSLPFFKDRAEYLSRNIDLYNNRDPFVDKCTYAPFISKEVFSASTDDVIVRCFNVSTLITLPDKTYKVDNMDMVCFMKDGVWRFYTENFPAHDLYAKDRIDLLLSFLVEEGFDNKDCTAIKDILMAYTGIGLQFNKYEPKNDSEKSILQDYTEMMNIIFGKKPGDILNYTYVDGFKRILGDDASENKIRQMFSEMYHHNISDISIIPFCITKEKVTNHHIDVYSLLTITCREEDRHLGNVLKSRMLCIKRPNDRCWQFLTIDKADDEMESMMTIMLDGVLTKQEVHEIINKKY